MLIVTKIGKLDDSNIGNCPIYIPNKLTSLSPNLRLKESEVSFISLSHDKLEPVLELYFNKFFAGDKSLKTGFADISVQELYLWNDAKIASNIFVKEVVNSAQRFAKVVSILKNTKQLNKSQLLKLNKQLRPKDKMFGIRATKMRAGNPTNNPHAFYCVPADQINELFTDWLDFINYDTEFTINKALIGMMQFIFIHPFKDGNGRTSRALFLAMMQQEYGKINSSLFMLYLKNINRMGYYSAMHDYRDGDVESLKLFYLQAIDWVNKSVPVLDKLFIDYTNKVTQEKIDNDSNYSQIVISQPKTADTINEVDFEFVADKSGKSIYINKALLSCVNQFDYYLRYQLREVLLNEG